MTCHLCAKPTCLGECENEKIIKKDKYPFPINTNILQKIIKFFTRKNKSFIEKTENSIHLPSIPFKSTTGNFEIDTITDEANDFLNKIGFNNDFFSNTKESLFFIYGGAVRDSLFKKTEQISDLDIYIKCDYYPRTESQKKIKNTLSIEKLKTLFENVIEKDTKSIYQGYTGDSIYKIIKISDPKLKHDVDVVFGTEDIHTYLDTGVDFDLCKVAIDLKNSKIIATPEFKTDFTNKTITYNQSNFTIEMVNFSLDIRLPKLLKKYSDFLFNYNEQLHYPTNLKEKLETIKSENHYDFYDQITPTETKQRKQTI